MPSDSQQRRTPDELRREYEQSAELQAEIEFDQQGSLEVRKAFRLGVKLCCFAHAWRPIEEHGWSLVEANAGIKNNETELARTLEVHRSKLGGYTKGEASAEVLVCAMATCQFQWHDLGEFPSHDALGLAGIIHVLERVADELVPAWQCVAVILALKQPEIIKAIESGQGLVSPNIEWAQVTSDVKKGIELFLPLLESTTGMEDLDSAQLQQLVERLGVLIVRCQTTFAWLGEAHA